MTDKDLSHDDLELMKAFLQSPYYPLVQRVAEAKKKEMISDLLSLKDVSIIDKIHFLHSFVYESLRAFNRPQPLSKDTTER